MEENEKVGKRFEDYMGIDDKIIEIGIKKKSEDWKGIRGIERDMDEEGIGKIKKKMKDEVKGEGEKKVKVIMDKDEGKKLWNGFEMRMVKGVKNGNRKKWMKKRMKEIGMRKINEMVEIKN